MFNSTRSRNPGFDNTFNTDDDVFGSPGVPQNNADGTYTFNSFFKFNEQVTGRKSPTYLNGGYSRGGIFWDGRADDIFRDPLTNALTSPADYSQLGALFIVSIVVGLVLPFAAIWLTRILKLRSA